MEEKELTINLELAKSWFTLAEIFIILAGFMFALVGVFWSGAFDSLQLTRSSIDSGISSIKK